MPIKKQSSRKLLKKGGAISNIFINKTISINELTYNTLFERIYSGLKTDNSGNEVDENDITEILQLLDDLNVNNPIASKSTKYRETNDDTPNRVNIFQDINDIVIRYTPPEEIIPKIPTAESAIAASNAAKIDDVQVATTNKAIHTIYNFQTPKFIIPNDDTLRRGEKWLTSSLWGKYNLSSFEDKRIFITLDPTIIQILIFDKTDEEDVVYSLKLIIKSKKALQLRYTTKIFPADTITEINTKISDEYNDLTKFIDYNKAILDENIANDEKFTEFLTTYLKFYNYYKKCYTFRDVCATTQYTKEIINYELKYISILGKARFRDEDIKKKTAEITDYVMSNLIFASPTYGFISGGYKGFKDDAYGITRSGYEIAKKYNRPILTIMCKEGTFDSHEYSDATLIYGEHWGEDTIGLSQFTDGAVVFAPFGGWTYVECLGLLEKKKIVGIYNNSFNILNYIADDKIKKNNTNFFKFLPSEQNSIIDYYINYYLILMYLHQFITEPQKKRDLNNFNQCLSYGIRILMHFKTMFADEKNKSTFSEYFVTLINTFKDIKTSITTYVDQFLDKINHYYNIKLCANKEFQYEIPERCDGIWIKPRYDLIKACISHPTDTNATITQLAGGHKKKAGSCTEPTQTILEAINLYKININDSILSNILQKKLNNNIIFVFSDVLFLNMYLTKNLSTYEFEKELEKKIKGLSQYTGVRDILNKNNEKSREVTLSRSIDDMLGDDGRIIKSNIIKDEYTFIINDNCVLRDVNTVSALSRNENSRNLIKTKAPAP
jgi:hypothetical protein